MDKHQHIRLLYGKFLDNTIQEDDYDVLLRYFGEDADKEELEQLMMEALEREHETLITRIYPEQVQQAVSVVKVKLDESILQKPRRRTVIRRLLPYVAAAVLMVVGALAYLFLRNTEGAAEQQMAETPADIAPETNRAVLKLANGTDIVLDDKRVGVRTQDGEISYADGTNIESSPAAENVTLETPRAGQYQVQLPDGTKVWLNASSSISYPTRFPEEERKVSVTGEVYMEVAKDASKPFYVSAKNQEIEVLGTHFNINTYGDNEKLYTTLVEGCLKIKHTASGLSKLLYPGDQAVISTDEADMVVQKIDTERVVSWKDGFYSIKDQSLSVFSKQIERWYDVSIDMKDKGNTRLSAIIPRDANLSEVLQAIEIKTGITFKTEGRRITVR